MYSAKILEIRDKIVMDTVKVVSFDMFDTLVLRPCCAPTDIFKLIPRRLEYNEEFIISRQQAEKNARRNKPYYEDDITIHDIYREFSALTNVSNDVVEMLLQEELNVEFEHLYSRKSMQFLFNEAKRAGKEVIITTDMYLPSSFLKKVLENCGYVKYDMLYVSSEEKLAKGTGRLFHKIIKDYSKKGINAEQIVHIGDNYNADYKKAVEAGLDAIHIPSCMRIMQSKVRFDSWRNYSRRTDNCFITGLMANYLFDDPYLPFNNDSVSGGDAKKLGSVMYGPFLLAYVKWLITSMKRNSHDSVLFVYRDGYLLKEIFEKLESIYEAYDKNDIYLSRTIRYNFFGETKNGLINSLKDFPVPENMTVYQFITKRLLLSEQNEIQQTWKIFLENGYNSIEDNMGKIERYFPILNKINDMFFDKTREQINNIKEYCMEIIPNDKSIAVVDVGYRGSVGTFLKDRMSVSTSTYQILGYPLSREQDEYDYKINTFIKYGFQTIDECMILHPLIEDVISIQEGSAKKIIKEKGRYIICKEDFSYENEVLSLIQEGVLDFIDYCISGLGKDLKCVDIDKTMFWDFMINNIKNPNKLDALIIKKLSFKDCDFIAINKNNIYERWYENKGFQDRQLVKKVEPLKATNEKLINEIELKPWEKISKIHLMAIKICECLHIIKPVIKIKKWLKDPFFKKENDLKIQDLFIKDLEQGLKEATNIELLKNKTIVFAGAMASFDKGICNYINCLSKEFYDYNCIVLSEANPNGTKDKFSVDAIMVPQFLRKEYYVKNSRVHCPLKVKHNVEKKDYLSWAYKNLMIRHNDIESDYAYLLVDYAEQYINSILTVLKPDVVLLWNQFFAYHYIFAQVCKKRNIKVVYMEFGSLPGTISFEKMGQMGESYPSVCASEFKKLLVNRNELNEARKVLNYLEKSGMNRNVQPINDEISKIKNKLKKGKKVVFYAGVNDCESGLAPYNENTKKSHSPVFSSSKDVAECLDLLARENDWNIIYKPHPSVFMLDSTAKFEYNNLIIAKNVDINELIDISDVVVTLFSQVSYLALIRQKPVVMLGYNQLKEKECVYEAYSRKDVECTINDALKKGFTVEQREKFVEHTAQMNKYNLFDDLMNKEINYGQSVLDAAKYIVSE